MFQVSGRQDVSGSIKGRRTKSILLWLALLTGLAVSTFTLIEDLCLATACSDAASYTFFGVGMGWFGIAYFCIMLLLLSLRHRIHALDLALTAMVFSGIGAEFRLLWIQKHIIGSFCPLCVTICCALFVAAVLLLVEIIQNAGSGPARVKILIGWLAFLIALVAIGLAVAVVGVRALT